jgi:hypothetical protein
MVQTKAHESQPSPAQSIDFETTDFSFNLVSIGILFAAIAWGVKLFRSVEKRIDKIEITVEENTKDIIENKRCESVIFDRLETKLDAINIMAQEIQTIRLELSHLKVSVDKDFDNRNATINESRGRIYTIENNITELTKTVSILANNLAQGLPSLFGRRGVDHGDPPSNPQRY